MKSLKQIINRYIRSAAIVMALVILVVIAFAEILIEQGRVEDTAAGTFVRLEQIIEENENELKQVKEKYDKTCLHDAEAIAFLLQKDPEATNDTLKLKKYANLLEFDEIHIFDETGTIVSGTNPEYYGYSFSSGEQMAFFAPMLTDKSLQLVQDAGPNTAEGKNMQYSAVWSADGTFIVQVGKDPQLVTEAMEKNEISYIFHQLNISPAIDYCAVDSETLSVIGATNADMVGKTVAKLGISAESMQNEEHGFHANIEGKYYYCIFKKIETRYMGFIIPMDVLYERIPLDLLNLERQAQSHHARRFGGKSQRAEQPRVFCAQPIHQRDGRQPCQQRQKNVIRFEPHGNEHRRVRVPRRRAAGVLHGAYPADFWVDG